MLSAEYLASMDGNNQKRDIYIVPEGQFSFGDSESYIPALLTDSHDDIEEMLLIINSTTQLVISLPTICCC